MCEVSLILPISFQSLHSQSSDTLFPALTLSLGYWQSLLSPSFSSYRGPQPWALPSSTYHFPSGPGQMSPPLAKSEASDFRIHLQRCCSLVGVRSEKGKGGRLLQLE